MTRNEAMRATCPYRVKSIRVAYQPSSSKPETYITLYAHCLADVCPKWIDERQSGGAYRCRRADGLTVSECRLRRGITFTCENCLDVYGHCGA